MRSRGSVWTRGLALAWTGISLLAGELGDYVVALDQGRASWRELLAESGLRCGRCGSSCCGRLHGWWRRKRVVDLSTGAEYPDLRLCRVIFCDGSTRSVFPADLWRGRCTVSSVIEAVAQAESAGVESAWEWARVAGRGGPQVSRRSLRRWKVALERRLVPGALSWLSDAPWSAGDRLERWLALRGDQLLSLRVATGRAVLDKPACHSSPAGVDSSARPVAGRRTRSDSHETPRPRRPRGSWSARSLRGPPPEPQPGGR